MQITPKYDLIRIEGSLHAAVVGAQPTKTPVSVLQELCVKLMHITPKYDLIRIEGSLNELIFKYRVTVEEYIGNSLN
jgi:hypothetical protein